MLLLPKVIWQCGFHLMLILENRFVGQFAKYCCWLARVIHAQSVLRQELAHTGLAGLTGLSGLIGLTGLTNGLRNDC